MRIGHVQVFAVFDPYYHGFYLAGLAGVVGRRALRFGRTGFADFARDGLAFHVEPQGFRVYLDCDDCPDLDPAAVAWAHVYAKVNLDPGENTAGGRARLLPIGPGFGTREAWLLPVLPASLAAAARSRGGEKGARTLAQRWAWMMARRPRLDALVPGGSEDPDYLFMAASVWAPADACNGQRARLLEAARRVPGLRLEGGFTPPHRDDVPEALPHRLPSRYVWRDYQARTQRSLLAFNTPAVLDCHGWKLPEYLAMGKAIFSTPLLRALPAPLEHGRHLHLVEDTIVAMAAGIERLRGDAGYRRSLGQHARAYYLRHLHPVQVIRRVLDAAREP